MTKAYYKDGVEFKLGMPLYFWHDGEIAEIKTSAESHQLTFEKCAGVEERVAIVARKPGFMGTDTRHYCSRADIVINHEVSSLMIERDLIQKQIDQLLATPVAVKSY